MIAAYKITSCFGNLFTIFSVNYIVKSGFQLCESDTMIDNLDECKLASSRLNLNFASSESTSHWPYGCYNYGGRLNVYWNDNIYGTANAIANVICETGEWFKLITINLLYA